MTLEIPHCANCGSLDICLADVTAKWNAEVNDWQIASHDTEIDCFNCDHKGDPVFKTVINDIQSSPSTPKTETPEWINTLAGDSIRDAARGEWQDDELEIDDTCYISIGGDRGVWVSAWVWMTNDGLKLKRVGACKAHHHLDTHNESCEIPADALGWSVKEADSYRVFWDNQIRPFIYENSAHSEICQSVIPEHA